MRLQQASRLRLLVRVYRPRRDLVSSAVPGRTRGSQGRVLLPPVFGYGEFSFGGTMVGVFFLSGARFFRKSG